KVVTGVQTCALPIYRHRVEEMEGRVRELLEEIATEAGSDGALAKEIDTLVEADYKENFEEGRDMPYADNRGVKIYYDSYGEGVRSEERRVGKGCGGG